MEDHNNFLDSDGDEDIGCKKDQKLESIKGEMEEAREENKRLKFSLERLVNDYQSLQMNFFDILQQDEPEDATKAKGTITTSHELENKENHELVSLGLSSKYKPTKDEDMDKRLAHGLDLNFDPMTHVEAANNSNTESSFGEEGKEEPTEMWPPSKVLKTMKIGDKSEASQHTHLKKARVSIRARCDTQTMNDGCQWRKYGQKRAKRNPCPRAYYRCTVSPSCPVRKQVQRCAEDMSILISTYEGTHNHPLPMSATAIASTTSVAASMLQSPSLTSQAHTPNALDFSMYQISRPQQFNFPNSFISTLNSHPIITLDLTAPPTSSNSRNLTSNLSYMPNYSSTNLMFSSGFSPLQSSMPHSHSPWSSYSGYFNSLAQNRNQGGCLLNTGKQIFQGHPYQTSYMSNHGISPIVAATKDNPKFESALATALTTCVGNEVGGGRLRENHVIESAELNLKLSSRNG